MTEQSKDEGVISVLMERFETQRLPRILEMKESVDKGELLSDRDLDFLQEVFADANKTKPLLDRHPEYQPLVSQMMSLYSAITKQALENEKGA